MLNNFAEDPNEELPLPKCVFYTESEASKFLDYISDLTSRSKNSSFNIGLWFREFARIQGYNSLSKKKIKARRENGREAW